MRNEYEALFVIHSDEEGKKLCSLVKKNFSKSKYFDDEVLLNMGIKGTIDVFCNKLGWSKLATAQYKIFFELTIEFYTTFKILDANQGVFSFRFLRKEYYYNYEIMFDIFGFLERGVYQPPLDYNMSSFWHEITRGDRVCEGQIMTSGLIKKSLIFNNA